MRTVVKRTCIHRALLPLGEPRVARKWLRDLGALFRDKIGIVIHAYLVGLFWRLNKIKYLAHCLAHGSSLVLLVPA